MKKLITLLLIAALLLPAAALADLPDISGLTVEELIELNHQIQLRLFSEQLVNGVKVPPGTYIIGEDIPAGTYRVEITGGTGFYDLNQKAGGYLIASGLTGSLYDVTEIGKMVLEDGNELKLYNSTFVLYPYTGLFN
jgi:hypothetical protein